MNFYRAEHKYEHGIRKYLHCFALQKDLNHAKHDIEVTWREGGGGRGAQAR